MLTQPHLLLNIPHSDFSTRNTAELVYTEPRTKRAPRLDSSSRESLMSASFFFLLTPLVLPSLLLFHLPPLFAYCLCLFSVSLSLSRFLSPLNILPLFPQSPLLLLARPLRRRRRRNVPIKSESHVLPISRQLNLVHAALAIATTRALCQDTPANSVDRRTLDEYSMSSSFFSSFFRSTAINYLYTNIHHLAREDTFDSYT